MVKVYTKKGDDGTTGLFGGGRVQKDDARVEAYGTVDEANSVIGSARSVGLPAEVDAVLARVQSDLFALGAELACVPGKEPKLSTPLIGSADIERLERAIDDAERGMEPLQNFILPGGTAAAAVLHQARTTCRRAERRTLSAGRESAGGR